VILIDFSENKMVDNSSLMGIDDPDVDKMIHVTIITALVSSNILSKSFLGINLIFYCVCKSFRMPWEISKCPIQNCLYHPYQGEK
jgi:hypothetical protein